MTTVPPLQRPGSAPISRLRSAVLLACSVALWQPLLYLFVHLIFREPRALVTVNQWAEYITMAIALGAIAGAVSYNTNVLSRGSWLRWWGGAIVSLLAGLSIIQADLLATSPWIVWLLVVLVASAVCGAILCTVARFVWMSIHSWDAS